MARDERPHSEHRPKLGPRELRASLSSSIGLPAGRGGRIEPDFGSRSDEAPAEIVAPELPFEALPAQRPPDPVDPATAEATRPEASPSRKRAPRRRAERPALRRRDDTVEPGSSRTIVPPQSVAGRALLLVVAIMCFLACLAVGALSLIAEAAHDWQLDVSREVTIQIKPVDGVAMEPRLVKAMELARDTAGVRSVRLIGEREGALLLEPWLGSGLDLSALPIPRLVVLELGDPATADLTGLKERIARDVRAAVVDDHAVWAARLRTMANTMVAVGFAVVGLMFAAMVLSVIFATRAAMAGNRDVIEVLHFVGAEDRFIAREFQRHFLVLGLQGGAMGGAAAIAAFIAGDFATRVRGDAFADQAHALFGGFAVGWSGHLGVVVVVAVVALLTAVTSRATVLGHLGRLD